MYSQVRPGLDVNLVQSLRAFIRQPGAAARLRVGAVRVVGDDGGRRSVVVVVENERHVGDVRVSVL